MSNPDIKQISIKEYIVKQSKYDQAQKLPVRCILLDPSGGGKGVLLQNMILDRGRNQLQQLQYLNPAEWRQILLQEIAVSQKE